MQVTLSSDINHVRLILIRYQTSVSSINIILPADDLIGVGGIHSLKQVVFSKIIIFFGVQTEIEEKKNL